MNPLRTFDGAYTVVAMGAAAYKIGVCLRAVWKVGIAKQGSAQLYKIKTLLHECGKACVTACATNVDHLAGHRIADAFRLL